MNSDIATAIAQCIDTCTGTPSFTKDLCTSYCNDAAKCANTQCFKEMMDKIVNASLGTGLSSDIVSIASAAVSGASSVGSAVASGAKSAASAAVSGASSVAAGAASAVSTGSSKATSAAISATYSPMLLLLLAFVAFCFINTNRH